MNKFSKVTIIIWLCSFSFIFADERKELLQNLEKISLLHQQLAEETAAWLSEKETLELQLSLLKREG
jgi:hypothetical protein